MPAPFWEPQKATYLYQLHVISTLLLSMHKILGLLKEALNAACPKYDSIIWKWNNSVANDTHSSLYAYYFANQSKSCSQLHKISPIRKIGLTNSKAGLTCILASFASTLL